MRSSGRSKLFISLIGFGIFSYELSSRSLQNELKHRALQDKGKTSDQVKALAKTMGISQPITVYLHDDDQDDIAYSFGINSPWTQASIVLHKSLANDTFVQAHELSHIKHNDGLISILLPLASFALYSPRTLWLCFPATFAFSFAYGRWSERRADMVAKRYAKKEDISKFIAVLQKRHNAALIDLHKNARHNTGSFFERHFHYTRYGNLLFSKSPPFIDIHPPETERIHYLRKAVSPEQANYKKRFAYTDIDKLPLQFFSANTANDEPVELHVPKETSDRFRQLIYDTVGYKNGWIGLEKIVLTPHKQQVELHFTLSEHCVRYTMETNTLKINDKDCATLLSDIAEKISNMDSYYLESESTQRTWQKP